MVISITVSSPETLYIQYSRMACPVYQYVINLVVSLPNKNFKNYKQPHILYDVLKVLIY